MIVARRVVYGGGRSGIISCHRKVNAPEHEAMSTGPAIKASTLWVFCILSVLTALYAAASMVVYSWLAEAGRWPTTMAALWTGAHLLLLLIAVVVFLYSVVNIIALRRRSHKD